jgi:sulfite exporter TauE/SafE/copper chaperone CopZ
MRTYLFHVSGMHCKACVLLIESELKDAPGVTAAKASWKQHQVEVTGDFAELSRAGLAEKLQPYIVRHNYRLWLEKPPATVAWKEFVIAVPVALAFLGLFVLLQKLGIVNLITAKEVNLVTAFIIGLIASVSTCMAIVGGLTLSISANFAKEGDKVRPQVMFHAGRLAAFFLLGGVIGLLGAQFELGQAGNLILNVVVGLVMLALGVNLLDVLPFMKRFHLTLPPFIARHIKQLQNINHTFTPALLGAATFFLPCGFTQSMQLYSLTIGSFMGGAMTMLVFALGTLPVLALLSFSSLGIHSRKASGVFFKTSGLIVIAFALFNLMNAMVIGGILQPVVRL